MRKLSRFGWLFIVLMMTGCSVIQHQQGEPVPRDADLAVVPLINLSQTPQAGDQAGSILAALLRAKTDGTVTFHLPEQQDPLRYDSDRRQREAIRAARQTDARFFVTGRVEEWRYKSGLDGEPAVGVTLEVRNIDSNRIVWSGTAARTGWGREGLSVAGHKVLDELTSALPLTD